MKYTILVLAGMMTVSAQASQQFKLTQECEATLKARILNTEKAKIEAEADELASDFEAKVALSYRPSAENVTVSVRLEDPADGRFARYSAVVTKAEARACKVWLERKDE